MSEWVRFVVALSFVVLVDARALQSNSSHDAALGDVAAVMAYAKQTWNCPGGAPPCPGFPPLPPHTHFRSAFSPILPSNVSQMSLRAGRGGWGGGSGCPGKVPAGTWQTPYGWCVSTRMPPPPPLDLYTYIRFFLAARRGSHTALQLGATSPRTHAVT